MLLHCGNALLIWLLSCQLWWLIFKQRMTFFPFLIALFYAIHPVNTTTVSYAFSRSDVLQTFFYLSALLLFNATFTQPKQRYWAYGLSIPCFALSMLSKQSAATFPLIVLVFDFLVLSDCRIDPLRRRLGFHLGYWAVLLCYLTGRYAYFGGLGDLEAWKPIPAFSYCITQPFSIVKYLQLILVPIGLCSDHGIAPAVTLSDPRVASCWLFLAAVLATAVWAYRKRTPPARIAVFYIVWFFLTIAPTTSFLPTTAVVVENRAICRAWPGPDYLSSAISCSGARLPGRPAGCAPRCLPWRCCISRSSVS